MNKSDFRATWSPRVGDRAARLYLVARRSIGLGGLGVGLWVLMFVAAHSVNVVWFWIFTWGFWIADIALIVFGMVSHVKMARAMSDFLGMRIPWWSAPGLREREWATWCRRNAVTPG